ILGNHWYYHSFCWLLLTVFVYHRCCRIQQAARLKQIVIGCALAFMIVVNARMVFLGNAQRVEEQRPRSEVLEKMAAFVRENPNGQKFSVYAPAGTKENPVLFWIEQSDGSPSKPLGTFEAFYPNGRSKTQHD
ncbi:MAG TPA: hypothetical protein VLJ10_00540, partial [Candidatus Bathyarchaeia archaeon]|nr:hypothetical protein [Candidatus Bathyarchaeia archaeon]